MYIIVVLSQAPLLYRGSQPGDTEIDIVGRLLYVAQLPHLQV